MPDLSAGRGIVQIGRSFPGTTKEVRGQETAYLRLYEVIGIIEVIVMSVVLVPEGEQKLAQNKSADEVLAELEEALGHEFGRDLSNLKNWYLNLRVDWRYYRSLFGTNPERVALLNRCSGPFFGAVERVLFEVVVIGLCRLLDPVETGRGANAKRNMTFKSLVVYLNEGDERNEYLKLLDVADQASEFARDWRNRRIAHADYKVALGIEKLEPASRAKVQTLIDRLGDVLQWIYRKKLDSDLHLDVLMPLEDEMSVMHLLHQAIEAERHSQEQNRLALERQDYAAIDRGEPRPAWLSERHGT